MLRNIPQTATDFCEGEYILPLFNPKTREVFINIVMRGGGGVGEKREYILAYVYRSKSNFFCEGRGRFCMDLLHHWNFHISRIDSRAGARINPNCIEKIIESKTSHHESSNQLNGNFFGASILERSCLRHKKTMPAMMPSGSISSSGRALARRRRGDVRGDVACYQSATAGEGPARAGDRSRRYPIDPAFI